MTRSTSPLRVDQALAGAATLSRLAERARASQRLLDAVLPALPAALRSTVQAGPLDGAEWCLLVTGSAAAAKIRQLLPDVLARAQTADRSVQHIRLRLVTPRPR